MQKQNI